MPASIITNPAMIFQSVVAQIALTHFIVIMQMVTSIPLASVYSDNYFYCKRK